MEASAFAAAALARSGAEAEGLRAMASSLDSELSRSRADVRRLQAEQQRRQWQQDTRGCTRCQAAQRRVSELDSEVQRLQQALRDSESLRQKEVEDAWSAAESAEAKLQETLGALRRVLSSQGGTQQEASQLTGDGHEAWRL